LFILRLNVILLIFSFYLLAVLVDAMVVEVMGYVQFVMEVEQGKMVWVKQLPVIIVWVQVNA